MTMECCWCGFKLRMDFSKNRHLLLFRIYLFIAILLCQSQSVVDSQRIDRLSCERRPTHTTALKTPGDNGFSIKILGSPPIEYYKPGQDYQVLLNGSYTNQQFLDFMLVAVLKKTSGERQTAGTFMHKFSHMTKEDAYCNHIMTSVTFHPSYKKSTASFTWTAPMKGSGCVLFKATVLEHPDIWFSDDGGLTKMFCEKPDESAAKTDAETEPASQSNAQESSAHSRRQSSKCCACDVAKYELTFVGNWSRETHPKDFPSTQHESLLHWSDIIGASHSPSYSVWSYGSMATAGVKEVCEYGWPRTLEGEIKQQSRKIRTVITAKGIWSYPNIYTTKRSARFSADNARPLVSLLTMVGPSPDWCIGIDSVNMCLENCTWLDKIDLELYPWDAGTDSGVTYLSSNLPTFPRDKIRPISNKFPNNTASPFYGEERIKPMATVSIRRVGVKNTPNPTERCEANNNSQPSTTDGDGDEEGEDNLNTLNPKCMVTEWSGFGPCSVTCGVGTKTRTRRFKHPMGTLKMCPKLKLQEMDNCLGLVNKCEFNPDEPVDVCVSTPWSSWSPCSVSCGSGSHVRTRQYLNSMGPAKCSTSLLDSQDCQTEIDCKKYIMNTDWDSVCKQEQDIGMCTGNFTRFFYDVAMKKCRPFDYSGCRGNTNKFDTMEECQQFCGSTNHGGDGDAGVDEDDDVDCMVTEWSDFSPCTVSCGTGLRSRSRMIKRRNSGQGSACPKDLNESKVCASECPAEGGEDVDCMLSEWSLWSECSQSCDDGIQTRQRMIKRLPQGQGQLCDSDRKQMRACNEGDCYSLCMLSAWSGWTECSVGCGIGKRMRRRMAKREPCPTDTLYTEAQPCDGQQCEGSDCEVSQWTDWTECDVSCGGVGSQTRFRMILLPATNGGKCELEDPKEMEKRACFNGACGNVVPTAEPGKDGTPVDCVVGQWSVWTECSKTCGTGKQVRRRRMVEKRRNHGERCPPLKETKKCETGARCQRKRRLRRI